jgi:hypothetical protein
MEVGEGIENVAVGEREVGVGYLWGETRSDEGLRRGENEPLASYSLDTHQPDRPLPFPSLLGTRIPKHVDKLEQTPAVAGRALGKEDEDFAFGFGTLLHFNKGIAGLELGDLADAGEEVD